MLATGPADGGAGAEREEWRRALDCNCPIDCPLLFALHTISMGWQGVELEMTRIRIVISLVSIALCLSDKTNPLNQMFSIHTALFSCQPTSQ